MDTSTLAIEVKGISKSYGTVKALDKVSLDVRRGEIFGLIGPDGAGKTTLFKILVTLLNADEGTATVDGLDIVKDYRTIRSRVGYMPGKFSLYPDLTIEENMEFFATLFGVTVEQNYDLVAPIYKQIEPFKKRRAGRLSGGMKQKLALSCALIHKPSVLFLDEPTTGVDAVSRSEFWDMLHNLREQGLSILASTPYMDEASRCDRIALCNTGRVLDIDSPQHMVEKFDGRIYGIKSHNMYDLLKELRDNRCISSCYTAGEYHHLLAGAGFDLGDLKQRLIAKGHSDVEIKSIVPNIEDIFIKLLSNEQY
ncbi:MAG: ABC transporter ATP-binding protein [Muribaculaceae bacterium]|nr:ABC transporter ATP-binding protein [Muribaculaceae bacterium]MBR5086248.1 ABC transporter ATP-binding protein [Muribaculaceae bacterium]